VYKTFNSKHYKILQNLSSLKNYGSLIFFAKIKTLNYIMQMDKSQSLMPRMHINVTKVIKHYQNYKILPSFKLHNANG